MTPKRNNALVLDGDLQFTFAFGKNDLFYTWWNGNLIFGRPLSQFAPTVLNVPDDLESSRRNLHPPKLVRGGVFVLSCARHQEHAHHRRRIGILLRI